jgi:hypothetical protein
MINDPRFVFMVSMRKIQSEYINPDFDKIQQFIIGITCRAYCSHDLGPMEGMIYSCLFIHGLVEVFCGVL